MLKIAIIGAGPGGLTLANLLHKSQIVHQISVVVFEKDASAISRVDQGGTLDLHADTGLAALHKAGLLKEFQKIARYDGDEMSMADKNNTVLVHKGPTNEPPNLDKWDSADDRPEIDRADLEMILRGSLPDSIIRWGHKLENILEEGILQFTTSDSKVGNYKTEGPFDLVVGADGAWSKVRKLVTSIEPQYSGISGYEMTIARPAKTCPRIHAMAGQGSYISNSDGMFLNCQRMGNDSLKVRSWYRCPEFFAQERLDKLGPEGTLDEILVRYDGWSSELLELLTEADVKTMRVWPCYELPVGHKWIHKKGFTLIGDAASLAAPFSGEGVNKAMRDALDLTSCLEKAVLDSDTRAKQDLNADFDNAVLKYEETMFPRALKIQKMTRGHIEIFFNGESLPSAIPQMIAAMAASHESFWVRVIAHVRPLMWLAFSYFWVVSTLGARRNRRQISPKSS